MNKPSAQRTNWRYRCSGTHVTQKWTSSHKIVLFIVTQPTSQSNSSASQNMRANGNISDANLERMDSVSVSINRVMNQSDAVGPESPLSVNFGNGVFQTLLLHSRQLKTEEISCKL